MVTAADAEDCWFPFVFSNNQEQCILNVQMQYIKSESTVVFKYACFWTCCCLPSQNWRKGFSAKESKLARPFLLASGSLNLGKCNLEQLLLRSLLLSTWFKCLKGHKGS